MCNSGNKFQPKKVVKANVRLQLKVIDYFMYIEYKSNPSYALLIKNSPYTTKQLNSTTYILSAFGPYFAN